MATFPHISTKAAPHRCQIKKELPPAPYRSRKDLSLQKLSNQTYQVHIWNDGTFCNLRETFLIKEGFTLNPHTILVESPDKADIIVWVSTGAAAEKEMPPSCNYSTPVVILDYSDGCSVNPHRYKIGNLVQYFKRSFVLRHDGVYVGNCTRDQSILPIAYSGAGFMVNQNKAKERPVVFTNLLRVHGSTNENRKRVVGWTKSFFIKHNYTREQAFIGQAGGGGAGSGWDQTYLDQLAKSKIIITANPNRWEGDFRVSSWLNFDPELVSYDATRIHTY